MLEDQCIPPAAVLAALPVFPLPNAVLLPGMILPLNVFEPRYLAMVDHVLAGGRHIGVPLLRPGFEDNYDGRPDVEPVFGIGRLVSHQRLPDGRRFIRLEGLGRVRYRQELPARADFRELRVEMLAEGAPQDEHQLEVLKAQLERISATLDGDDARMVACVLDIPDPRIMVYAITAIMPTLGYATHAGACAGGRPLLLDVQQRCLEAESPDERVGCLVQCAARICAELGDSGRWPGHVWN